MIDKAHRKQIKREYLSRDPMYHLLRLQTLSLEDLSNTNDDELEWKVSLVITNRITGKGKEQCRELQKLSAELRGLYATSLLEGMVFNGGFEHYFFCEQSCIWAMAVEGYRLFGMNDLAEVTLAAIRKQEENVSDVDAESDPDFENEERTFYQLFEEDNLTKARYIRNHPELFVIQ